MNHYICKGGCRGVAEEAGQCQSTACSRFGQALDACDCSDESHYGAFEPHHEDSKE